MFGVVPVKKPNPIVDLVVAAHPPGERLIRITAVVAVEPVQIGKAVTEIIKREEETNVTPVENPENNECRDKERKFYDTPESLTWIFTFQFLEDGLGVFAEKAEE
jgi:hypothetical protein